MLFCGIDSIYTRTLHRAFGKCPSLCLLWGRHKGTTGVVLANLGLRNTFLLMLAPCKGSWCLLIGLWIPAVFTTKTFFSLRSTHSCCFFGPSAATARIWILCAHAIACFIVWYFLAIAHVRLFFDGLSVMAFCSQLCTIKNACSSDLCWAAIILIVVLVLSS